MPTVEVASRLSPLAASTPYRMVVKLPVRVAGSSRLRQSTGLLDGGVGAPALRDVTCQAGESPPWDAR